MRIGVVVWRCTNSAQFLFYSLCGIATEFMEPNENEINGPHFTLSIRSRLHGVGDALQTVF